jgi:hypothetical protein
VYRPEVPHDATAAEHAQQWLNFIAKYSKSERDREARRRIEEEFGSSKFKIFRAKTKRFYESNGFQMYSAVLVVAAFLMDMSQAQLLPPNGSPLAEKYAYCDTVLTVLFAKELLINLFARSADYFREFVTKWANWFDVLIVGSQICTTVFVSGIFF